MSDTQEVAHVSTDFSPTRELTVEPAGPPIPIGNVVIEGRVSATGARERGTGGVSVWEKTDKGNYYPIGNTVPKLPAQRFNLGYSQNQGSIYLAAVKNVNDRLYPSGMVSSVLNEVKDFWAKKDRYKKLGLLWRRNLLLWGPPGTGKTLIAEAVARFFVEQGGFVINYQGAVPGGLGGALQTIRGVEPIRPILILVEDMDQMIQASSVIEQDLLQFLDGASKAENVITIATSNFPEKMGIRFLRPGRFDLHIQVPQPDRITKIGYLRAFDPDYFSDERMEQWLLETEGLTFAELKEVVLRTLVYEKPLSEAVRTVRPEARKPHSATAAHVKAVGHYQ